MANEKIQNNAEREANRTFFQGVYALDANLKDKGFAGMRGSSREHELLVQKYDTLRERSAQLVNATPSEREQAEKNRRKAMKEAREAAQKYVDAKLQGRDVSSFKPGSKMGRNRFQAALDLITQIDQEMERLHQMEAVSHQDAEVERPAVPQPEQTVIRNDAPENMHGEEAAEVPAEEAAAEEIADGAEAEDPELQAKRKDLEKLESMNKESERERTEAAIPPDPEDPFDMQGWADKLAAMPDEKPGDPVLAEEVAKESVKCVSALMLGESVLQDMGSFDDASPEQFHELLGAAMDQIHNNLDEYANGWTSIMERKQALLEKYPPSMERDAPELNDQAAPESPEEEKIAGIPDDYLDPQTYVEMMQENDITRKEMPYETAKTGVLNGVAMMINAQICRHSDEKPTAAEFNNSTIDILDSPEFGEIIENAGGTGWNALEKLQKRVMEGGNSLYGEYTQHRKHNMEREKAQEQQREQGARQRELQSEHKLENNRIMGA